MAAVREVRAVKLLALQFTSVQAILSKEYTEQVARLLLQELNLVKQGGL